MSFDRFHPLVRQWFTDTIGNPTTVQSRGWAAIGEKKHTLIAAPTGSGKTLAAFLTALDDLLQEGLQTPLPDEVRVIYVSPLKALSADIHKNLAEPRREIRRLAEEAGLAAPRITAAVRTGDTTQSERAAMLRRPPHILVTTPESLYLLLTAERSREILKTVRTVIVDEIHAVIGTRRGAHLAISIERLRQIATKPFLRLGLSATQNPIAEVARYLTGHEECAIVDEGHRRAMDLAIETPRSAVETVMANEVWEDYYDRLTQLINEHKTTLVFVNTRRMAERVARHLSERLGETAVTAHHGSLSKDKRLDAESRLKSGSLKALVATASLELGIDIGHVDLVCQIGSPHRIATLLQRVGRSGHSIKGLPRGRLFPISRDDLIECAALLREVRRGALDRIVHHDRPLDVLAQQIVAETSCADYGEDELFALMRMAWPYRDLSRSDFDAVLAMVSEGFATRRGRRGALVHRDEVNAKVRGRRGSRMLAITSGGAIPEVADYRVLLEPEDTVVGTLNEDFAIESNAGDIFQLGNASWQITRIGSGVVRVADAKGAPPTIPFWLGEAPSRSDELSRAVSELRDQATSADWLQSETGLSAEIAGEIVTYLDEGRRALGVMPTQETLVLERFFDESGGMQLVLHAPFGSRINKAWGLALRKRFCRQFNFELQAAATEDAILLSLGPQHSFPLADVFRYLHPATARDVLVQAMLAAPLFQTRWRWNTTISLAIPRNRGGKKVPPPLQRAMSDDLMAAVFPDAAACPENLPGDRELPDHPLVNQVVRDCLEEAMDFDGLARVLTRIHAGETQCVARDTTEPSPLAHEILNAKPYAFLDDAPLEERRTQAVMTRRVTAGDLSRLDVEAIARVRDEERPDPRDPDELHDALVTFGFLLESEIETPAFYDRLVAAKRAGRVGSLLVAAERLPEILAIHPAMVNFTAPHFRAQRTWTREEAMVEIVRGRMSLVGPITSHALAHSLDVTERECDQALTALEAEGCVLRGSFESTFESDATEWCDRRLLARIHRYTLHRLRAEIEPVTAAELMRFLFSWQHAVPSRRLAGADGLHSVIAALDGFEIAAAAWERFILPLRVDRYDPSLLDALSFRGDVAWLRLSPAGASSPIAATPVAICLREHVPAWLALRSAAPIALSEAAQTILEQLRQRGPSFARDLGGSGTEGSPRATIDGSLPTGAAIRAGIVNVGAHADDNVEANVKAIGELVAAGLISSDGFGGLRALIGTARDHRASGRWALVESIESPEAATERFALTLLQRYGVVFRRLLARESIAVPWRELARIYRRLEARGEIRGGRFVAGMSGEQFALPEAVTLMRETRREKQSGTLVVISAADPLNLVGVITSDERVRAIPSTRIAYRDGVALSVMEGDYLRPLAPADDAALEIAAALAGRRVPVASGFVGRSG